MNIRVLNLHLDDCTDAVYIGRPGKGRPGSPLANPFRLKQAGGAYERGETIQRYEAYLRQELARKNPSICAEMNRLFRLAQRGELRLACYCKRPDREVACHGDVIARLLREAHQRHSSADSR